MPRDIGPKGVFISIQLNWTQPTQLNSVHAAKSVVFLFMTSWPTIKTESTVVHAVELSSVELSCVAINGP